MSDNTKIEWADATVSGKDSAPSFVEAGDHHFLRSAAGGVQPFPNVTVAFAAVAAPARRYNVGRLRSPAMLHRKNMVERFGRRRAIGTLPVEHLEEVRFPVHRHGIDATFTAANVSDHTLPARRIARVPLSLFARLTGRTCALARHVALRQPSLAPAAPSQALLRHGLPFWFARSGSEPRKAAGAANVRKPVGSRAIPLKPLKWQALSAFRASLHAPQTSGEHHHG